MVILNDTNFIGDSAFSCRKDIEVINLPDYLVSINNSAFAKCTKLKTITIPKGVKYIGECAFFMCENLTSINMPDSLDKIRRSTFYNCKNLKSLIIPRGVKSIDEDAFQNCENLESISLPDSLESIKGGAFQGCKNLKTLTIPNGVRYIGPEAFQNCEKLESIILPDNLESIEEETFQGCKHLKTMTIPKNVKSIYNHAFRGCVNLESIVLSDSVEIIAPAVFKDCNKVNNIIIDTTDPESFNRIKMLLPNRLISKALRVDVQAIRMDLETFKLECLKPIMNTAETNLLYQRLGYMNEGYSVLPPEIFTHINHYANTNNPYVAMAKKEMDRVTFPFTEESQARYREQCQAISNKYILLSVQHSKRQFGTARVSEAGMFSQEKDKRPDVPAPSTKDKCSLK